MDEVLKIGELAARSGVSVRTLHHYDAIGLLVPSFTTGAGHRRYAAADVERLQHVRSLRELGFSLEAIASLLERGGTAPLNVLELHLARVREGLEAQRRLAARLDALIDVLRRDGAATTSDFLETLTAMSQYEELVQRHFTTEQLERLAERRAALGEEGLRAGQEAWQALYADVRAAVEADLDPASDAARALLARQRELIHAFSGGDAGLEAAVARLRAEPAAREDACVDPAVEDYLRRVAAAE